MKHDSTAPAPNVVAFPKKPTMAIPPPPPPKVWRGRILFAHFDAMMAMANETERLCPEDGRSVAIAAMIRAAADIFANIAAEVSIAEGDE